MSFNSACDSLLISSAYWNRRLRKRPASSESIRKSQGVKSGEYKMHSLTTYDAMVSQRPLHLSHIHTKAVSVERLANQRLHLGRDEVSDWLDAQRSTLTVLV
ncbi:hypothetical protein TNCV_5072251 [Trichonephila clavipes]|nr:hypothetical protein TNCV_5072251 [Trichonephila clavipes]